jgi:hypothetical protein
VTDDDVIVSVENTGEEAMVFIVATPPPTDIAR